MSSPSFISEVMELTSPWQNFVYFFAIGNLIQKVLSLVATLPAFKMGANGWRHVFEKACIRRWQRCVWRRRTAEAIPRSGTRKFQNERSERAVTHPHLCRFIFEWELSACFSWHDSRSWLCDVRRWHSHVQKKKSTSYALVHNTTVSAPVAHSWQLNRWKVSAEFRLNDNNEFILANRT